MTELRRKKAKKARQVGMKDGDFEKMFGENIDQFLEDSEWDVDSFDKMSHVSKNSAHSAQNQMKLKAMEKVYLSRIETQNQGQNLRATQQNSSNGGFNPSGSQQRSQKKIPKVPNKKGGPRETQDRFVDDPDYIRRGQQWDFDTKKKNEEQNSSSKQKQSSPLRGPIDQANYPK